MTAPTPAPAAADTTEPTRKPKPAPTVRRWSVWEPDPRWAHPLEAALWCYVLALVAHYPPFGIPPWALSLLGPVAAAVGVGRARRGFPEHDYGDELRNTLGWIAAIAAVAGAGWMVYACYTSPLRALGWLVLGTAWFGAWYTVVRTGAPKRAAEIVAEREEIELEAATSAWADILQAAGLPLKVVETRSTRAGYVLGVEPIDEAKPVTFAALESKVGDLAAKAAARLAREGLTVGARDIRVEETDAGHVHLIHVRTKQILAETIPFEPIEEPTTIADPVDPALYEDGKPVEITFGGEEGGTNGKIVGATGSGKTVTANSLIGKIGETVDCLVGVVASNKLVALTYPWLRPWLDGRADRPGIDFVAGQDPQRVLEFLAGVYRIVCERNARLANHPTHVATPTAPAMVLFVEEAGKMAIRKNLTVKTHDGLTVGFSQLVDMICSEDRSALVSIILMNQSDLYGALGDYGPNIARNTPLRICLKTLAFSDGPSTLPALVGTKTDTTKLRHHSMLVQPSIDEPRVLAAKAYGLEGEAVQDIAIRNSKWRPELEADIAALLGDVWINRWDAARLPELVAAAKRDGLEWPVGTPEDPIDVEFRQLLEQHQQETPAAAEAAAAPAGDGQFPDVEAGVAKLTEIAERPALELPGAPGFEARCRLMGTVVAGAITREPYRCFGPGGRAREDLDEPRLRTQRQVSQIRGRGAARYARSDTSCPCRGGAGTGAFR